MSLNLMARFGLAIRVTRLVEDGEFLTTVEVDMARTPDPGAVRTTLTFFRAVEVELGDLSVYRPTPLAISSIRDWGWERVSYSVRDVEGDLIALKCERWSRSDP